MSPRNRNQDATWDALAYAVAVCVFVTIILLVAWPSEDAEASHTHQHRANQAEARLFAARREVRRLQAAKRRRDTPLIAQARKWERLAWCESTQRWHISGAFDGGLQFHRGTWRAYGGTVFAPRAHQASPLQQAAIAELVLRRQGRGAWPSCSRRGAW